MCRIYGHFNAVVSPEELDAVSALQRHGGPDASGIRQGNTWSLGSNRLAIMDPDGGRQPYELPDGTVIVAFNGEIYNHAELRGQLRRRGYEFADHCDGSILPALYHCYGDRFTEHIDGMYAIAVLDLRAGPRLLLATDHLGMKPVYYSWHAGRKELYFSSEVPSLLAFRAVSGRRRTPGLNAYLATKTPFGQQTMFADVDVLPPSVIAVCDPVSGLRVHRSRPPGPASSGAAYPAGNLAGNLAGDEVRGALRRETGALLAADVPVATITSGGLDSSLVTVFAAERNAELHTFNIAYTGSWPDDERHYARQVASRTGAAYHQVEIDPATFPDVLPAVVWHLGQPNADPITLSTYALFAAVHDAGFKVALTGDGADEVFGGYARMRAAAIAAAAGRPWQQAYLDELAAVPARLRRRLYTGEYAAEAAAAPPPVPAEAVDLLYRGGGTVLDRITAFELEYRLPAYHLRRVDHLSMAHAVEVRLPFCQRRIYGLGRQLSDEQRIGAAGVKLSLYRAAAGLLPPAVLARPKQPFTLPVAAMLTPGWPLWEFANDMLGTARLRQAGEIEPRQVHALFAAQAVRPSGTIAMAIWSLLVYQIWCEQVTTLAGLAEAGVRTAGPPVMAAGDPWVGQDQRRRQPIPARTLLGMQDKGMRHSSSPPLTGYLTYAEGAPCPTLVLDARSLPRESSALLAVLAQARRWLAAAGDGNVLKFALVEPSPDRVFDLDYRFIQALPDSPESFDTRGSCGHSLLGAVMASAEYGMMPPLAPGRPVRVYVQNNGDRVTCEVEQAGQDTATFTVRFRYAPPRAIVRMLMTGEPRTALDVDGERVTVSLVSSGNPYVFVDAASVGVASVDELFAGPAGLLDRLVRIRTAAADLLGWPSAGAFPKVAATLPAGLAATLPVGPEGGVAVRAVSVPGWHPTLALTGSVCLAAAINIPGTVPWRAARAGGSSGDPTEVHTPGGRWPVSVAFTERNGVSRLAEVTVGRRHVTCHGALRMDLPFDLRQLAAYRQELPAPQPEPALHLHLHRNEDDQWVSRSA